MRHVAHCGETQRVKSCRRAELSGRARQAQMALIISLKSIMKLNEMLRLEDLPKLKDVTVCFYYDPAFYFH